MDYLLLPFACSRLFYATLPSARACRMAKAAMASQTTNHGPRKHQSRSGNGGAAVHDSIVRDVLLADVGDGIEYDIYLGYGIETEAGFSASLGYTTYQYTGDTFDDEYNEGNLNLGYGIFSLEYSKGTCECFGAESDYDFIGLTLGFDNGLYATAGFWGDESDGEYFEFGYGTTVAEIDLGAAIIFASDELSFEVDSDGNANEDTALVLSIGKSF